MKNLAGGDVYENDKTIGQELLDSGLVLAKSLMDDDANIFEFPNLMNDGEVKSRIIGLAYGWKLTRAWYYWVAEAQIGTVLPFDLADELHKTHGNEVRVAGHCMCPAPREWYNKSWHFGVAEYHIDTQDGLNEFVKYIKKACQLKELSIK